MTISQQTIPNSGIILTGEGMKNFKKAMKTEFYRDMLKEGILNQTEFYKLMEIINRKSENAP